MLWARDLSTNGSVSTGPRFGVPQNSPHPGVLPLLGHPSLIVEGLATYENRFLGICIGYEITTEILWYVDRLEFCSMELVPLSTCVFSGNGGPARPPKYLAESTDHHQVVQCP